MYSLPVLHRLSLSYSLSPKRQLCKIYSIKAESGLQVFHNLPQILFIDQPRTRAVQTQRHNLKTQIIRKHRIVIAHEKAVVRFPRLLHGFGLIPPKRHESCPQAPFDWRIVVVALTSVYTVRYRGCRKRYKVIAGPARRAQGGVVDLVVEGRMGGGEIFALCGWCAVCGRNWKDAH